MRFRRLGLQLGVVALLLAILVATAGALLSRRIAERLSVHDVATTADLLADSVVQPSLTNAMAAEPSTARALDPIVRQRVLTDDLIRVKLWSPSGVILYSDEPRLIGQRFQLDDEGRQALSTPRTQAEVSELSRPENQYERTQDRLLEVYRPVWTPDGHELLFESYYRYSLVSSRSAQLWHGFLGITLSAVAMLFVLLIPVVAAMWRRVRTADAARQASTEGALQASEDERRRIAAGLHDGPVQELAAASFSLTGAARAAGARGDTAAAAALNQAADTVRAGLAGLRSVAVELYPPALAAHGLTTALTDLAAAFAERGLPVRLAVDPAGLSEAEQQGVFRIVRECLQNTAKHASARSATVTLAGRVLTVEDDGRGFDPEALQPNHLGLNLLSDICRELGAGLELMTAAGAGTAWRVTL